MNLVRLKNTHKSHTYVNYNIYNLPDSYTNNCHAIPFFNSNITAGLPSPADEYLDDKFDLNDLIQNPKSTFFFVAPDSSMIMHNIKADNILIVDKNLPHLHGKLIVVFYEGKLMVRQLHRKDNNVSLITGHPDFKNIDISKLSRDNIWGVVTNIIHNVQN